MAANDSYIEDLEGTEFKKGGTPPPKYEDIELGNGKPQHKEKVPSSNSSESGKEEKEPENQLPYTQLYRYADKWDYILLIIGTISATIHGVSMPILFIFFGDLTTSFVSFGTYGACNYNYTQCLATGVITNSTTEAQFNQDIMDETAGLTDIQESIGRYAIYFTAIGVAVWIFGALQIIAWVIQAARQVKRIRIKFFESILRQDISYFDLNSSGELNVRLADDVRKIQDGIGDKVSMAIMNTTRAFAGLIIGLIYSWKLSLVVLATSPLLGLSAAVMFKLVDSYTKKELAAYAKAGGVAEEVLSSIRTVVAFGGEEKECERYSESLLEARSTGIKKGVVGGVSIGSLFLIMFSTYGLAFWYGSTLVFSGEILVGELLTAFFAILIGAFSLGQSAGALESVGAGKAAAYKVFEIIDRVPPIDSMSEEGHKPDRVTGRIEFKNVDFTYPSRPDTEVLHGVSLTAESGTTVALCGQSGCGKSTCVQLIQRFYDPQNGVVELDGVDVRTLNVKWLREHIGVVSQEPILFDTTIAENIRYGRLDVTDEQIEEATKKSNAYDFIMKFPNKFETMVGEGGAQMSGGQKQRIAIARAIVRDPKVMLLDEATSALDTESEAVVQAALDKASEGRTTIVIAHRLSTIRNADKIIGFHEGRALEAGNHDELLKVENGVYQNLVNMQSYNAEEVPLEPVHEKVQLARSISSQRSLRKRTISATSVGSGDKAEEVEEEEVKEEEIEGASFARIFKYNVPEIGYIIAGCLAAVVNGGIQPLFALLFAEILRVFALTDEVQQENEIRLYSLLFVGIGAAAFVANIVQAGCFAKSGEELTIRLRKKAFKSIMRQEISFFDDHFHSTGALTTRLASDASKVKGCTGVRLGTILQSIFALGVALGIAFAYGWQLTLLTLAFVPFMMIAGVLQMKVLTGQSGEEEKAFEGAGKIATEATINIRTVASLAREEKFLQNYKDSIVLPYKKSYNKAYAYGISFGFSQCIVFFAYAATFRFGAWLVEMEIMTFDNVFKVLMSVIFGAFAVGQASSYAPDYAEATISAARMFKLFESTPAIDTEDKSGEQMATEGNIDFKKARFNYPTRPDVLVLKGLDLSVKQGQTVALVGQSGCGKSTCIQLLERFYDPTDGAVTLEHKNLKDIQLSYLRSKMGIVSQEPVLFDRSIADNIRYGDNTRYADMKEVVAAAKNANIHDFISGLPDAYETNVGAKGTQLSGGQKQRVAIARALLRNPKVLLLDEATSALDAESEKVVQDALDSASQGRTTIIIAHRLSTVKNADVIAVIENGSVVETGSHAELIAMKGSYFSLVNAQLYSKS